VLTLQQSIDTRPGLAAAPLVLKRRKLFSWESWEPVIKLLVLLGGVGLIVLAYQQGLLNTDFNTFFKLNNPFFKYMFWINSIVFVGAVAFRTILWFRYRPYDSAAVESWPGVTVVVPAYNEGETVYSTISSIARGNYPVDRLRIIAVDDGSRDDTYSYILKAQKEFPETVRVIRFDTNQGKRQGIYEAYKLTETPFIVTVDSDTLLEPDALKELLTPLILNPQISGVTGRIRIWNSDANILTKMLKANFAMAFDFTRAVQSTFSTVFCTSGAFSAYRMSVVREVIDHWMRQTFLKRRCTYGEDRSLTNHILRTGQGTVFQRTAVAFTRVPEKLPKVLKMLTRWARSNIRESIIFSRIMLNSNRKGNHLLPFIEFITTVAIVFVHLVLFYYFLFSGLVDSGFILRMLCYTVMFGFFYSLYYIRIEGAADFPYMLAFSLFSSVFMVWIFTVAGMTLTTRSWSTR
jgi:hyaluronan synthase